MSVHRITTLKQLFAAMPRDGWDVQLSGAIRRGRQCPVTSVTGEMAMFWDAAAHEIGMTDALTLSILSAADFIMHSDPNIRELRTRLLRHCGLEVQG